MRFSGHYQPWIRARIDVLETHYGQDWFRGKKVLELGCGYADIGEHFHRLGAHVTCSDARSDHLEHLRKTKSFLSIMQHDLDDGQWPYDRDFDLILHTGCSTT